MQCTLKNLKWHEIMRLQSPGSVTSACKRHEVDPVPWFAKQGQQSCLGSVVFQLDSALCPIKIIICNSYSAISWRASAQYFVSIWVVGGIRRFVLAVRRCTSCQRGEMRDVWVHLMLAQNNSATYPSSPFRAWRPCSLRGLWQRAGSYPNHQILWCAPQRHGMQLLMHTIYVLHRFA